MVFVRNMSRLDRAVRASIGAALIGSPFFIPLLSDPILAGVLGTFGIVNVASAAFGHCPVYRLADISTAETPRG